MAIKLESETEKAMVSSIRNYFQKELDSEISNMQAGFVLNFFLKEIAPSVYNLAIKDAKAALHVSVADLEGTCFESEFAYWNKRK